MTVPAPDRGQAGFTLIELMISLGLFALIAVAGLGMVDGILGVQGRTEQRLDRLTDLQRAMYVIGGDLEQVAHGPITGDASGMRFTRAAPGLGGAPVAMAFRLNGDRMTRDSGRRVAIAVERGGLGSLALSGRWLGGELAGRSATSG